MPEVIDQWRPIVGIDMICTGHQVFMNPYINYFYGNRCYIGLAIRSKIDDGILL